MPPDVPVTCLVATPQILARWRRDDVRWCAWRTQRTTRGDVLLRSQSLEFFAQLFHSSAHSAAEIYELSTRQRRSAGTSTALAGIAPTPLGLLSDVRPKTGRLVRDPDMPRGNSLILRVSRLARDVLCGAAWSLP